MAAFLKSFLIPTVKASDDDEELVCPQAVLRVSFISIFKGYVEIEMIVRIVIYLINLNFI